MRRLILIITVSLFLLEYGCASFCGEKGLTTLQRQSQHHKPMNGESKRKIRPVALCFDIVFGLVTFEIPVAFDFLTGAIYKPSRFHYQCIVQKDSLKADTLNEMTFQDKEINFLFSVTQTGIGFKIDNKTKQSLKIDWNDVALVLDGTTLRAVHTGVKLINRNESQPPSTIPSNAPFYDEVCPSDNIEYNIPNKYNSGGWVTHPLNVVSSIRLFLPIQYQGKTINYNITFIPVLTHP